MRSYRNVPWHLIFTKKMTARHVVLTCSQMTQGENKGSGETSTQPQKPHRVSNNWDK